MKGINPYIFSWLLLLFVLGCATSVENSDQDCHGDFNIQGALAKYEKEGQQIEKIDFSLPLKPSKAKMDFQIFRQILEESSPNIYRYTTKQKMDSLFEAKLCQLNESVSYLEFIRHIAQVYNFMACGHSSWMHSGAYKTYRDSSMKFFPLKVFPEVDRYVVKYNASFDTSIEVGDEIIAINGNAPSEINSILRSYMYRDGQSAPKALTEIGLYFDNAYSNFISNPDSFRLLLKNKIGKEYSVNLAAQNKSSIDSLFRFRYPKEEAMGTPLRLSIDSVTHSALYTIKWFRNEYIQQHNQNFETFTDSAFQLISKYKISHLIIDLRGNKGGWTSNGRKLFSYFIDKPIDYIRSVEFKTIDTFSFRPLIISDQGINDTMRFEKNGKGLYEWINYPSLKVFPAKENRFKGKTYILIDDMSRSCSAIFSSLMQSHTDAIFVGEENGSAQSGTGGMAIVARLPYTGVIVTASTAKYSCNVSDSNNFRGIKVDYPVKFGWDDYLSGRDLAVEVVYEQIN